jgi:hypothetical protein
VRDRESAHFNPTFKLAVYLTATRRMPNSTDRWWLEEHGAFADGDIDYIELPVSEELTVYRDYVHPTDLAHPAFPDHFGRVLNRGITIEQDAKRRIENWKTTHVSRAEGEGRVESIHAFRDLEIGGPIVEIALEVSLEDDAPLCQTVVTCGNIADQRARDSVAMKRTAARRRSERGKVVA